MQNLYLIFDVIVFTMPPKNRRQKKRNNEDQLFYEMESLKNDDNAESSGRSRGDDIIKDIASKLGIFDSKDFQRWSTEHVRVLELNALGGHQKIQDLKCAAYIDAHPKRLKTN